MRWVNPSSGRPERRISQPITRSFTAVARLYQRALEIVSEYGRRDKMIGLYIKFFPSGGASQCFYLDCE